MGPLVDRRGFLAAALAAGVATVLPLELLVRQAVSAAADGGGFFLTDTPEHPRFATCAAICARIVPSATAQRAQPGAAEAGAAHFIDLFLAAFELPSGVADNPAIWIHGRFSGRSPYPDSGEGAPSSRLPADDFADPVTGTRHFLAPGRWQRLSWRVQLYGPGEATASAADATWRSQIGSLIPAPGTGLRDLYTAGLDAFDDYSMTVFGVHFAQATPEQQDLMLETAGDIVTGSLPVAPGAARALFPLITVHTFQGCYALPEYGGNRGAVMWPVIGWEGDTQPLGNSIYDDSAAAPGEGGNAGFGDPAVYQPRGGYREHRAVSGPDPSSAELRAADIAPLVAHLQHRGVVRSGRYGP